MATLITRPIDAQKITVANQPLVVAPETESIEIFIQTPPRPANLPKLALKLKDLTTSGANRFSLTQGPEQIAETKELVLWRTLWKLGSDSSSAKNRHALLAEWGEKIEILSINLSMEDGGNVRISAPSSPLRTTYSSAARIQTFANYAITEPVVQLSTLIDDRTGDQLTPDNFNITPCAPPPLPNAAGNSSQIVSNLCLTLESTPLKAGKYIGSIVLGTETRSNLGSFPLTVYSTSLSNKLVGCVSLLLGLVVYFAFSVIFKGYNRRLTALLPAVRLRETATQLDAEIQTISSRTSFPFPTLRGAVTDPGSLKGILNDLSPKSLNAYVSPVIANPFGQPDLSAEYRVFLATHTNQIESLKLIVRWGITTIDKKWGEISNVGLTDRGATALSALDRLAITAGGPTQMLINQIQGILDALQRDIEEAHKRKALGGAPPQVGLGFANLSSEYITIQLGRLSIAGWILWATITLIIGFCTLIWFNDAFGIGRDYLQCFLWGLGIPAIAQGFGGLNANSVASTFSLQLPR